MGGSLCLPSAQTTAPGQHWTFAGAAHIIAHRSGARVLRVGVTGSPWGVSFILQSPTLPRPGIQGPSFRTLGIEGQDSASPSSSGQSHPLHQPVCLGTQLCPLQVLG